MPEMKQRVVQLKKFIADNRILDLPEADHCTVVEMPNSNEEFDRLHGTTGATRSERHGASGDQSPTERLDAKKVTSYLEEYNNHMLDILAIHEATWPLSPA